MSDQDAIDAALGVAIATVDTFGTPGAMHHALESAPVTLSGTPAKADTIYIEVERTGSDVLDTFNNPAALLGVNMFYTIDAPTDD